MIPWFKELVKRLLFDASWPERWLRTLIAGAGGLVQAGQIPFPPKYTWVGSVIAAVALMIPAGEKNPLKP
jgi:hypothetical protein